MSGKTEIAVSLMPKLEDRIVDLSSKLEAIAREKAPEAWEVALAVVRVDALGQILVGVLLVAGAFFLIRVGRSWVATATAIEKERGERYSNNDEIKYGTRGVVALCFGAVAATGGAVCLLSIWNYVALYRPELVIARRLLDGVL